MIEFKCKHCFTKYAVRPELAGRTAECKHCGKRFMVPYTSPVVRLGDEDLVGGGFAAPSDDSADIPTAGPVASAPPRAHRPEAYRRADRQPEAAPASPLLPMPAAVAELWLPLGLLLCCVGLSAFVVLDRVLGKAGSGGGLILVAFAGAALVVIAFRLTMRVVEGTTHTFDLKFSNAITLQVAACLGVPLLGGVIGLVSGGIAGTVIGVVCGLLLFPLLLTAICQLPAGAGMQSGLLASLAFAGGYACSAVIVGGVANVMFSVWSVDLPWKQHATTEQLAAAVAPAPPVHPTTAVAPPSPAVTPRVAEPPPPAVATIVVVPSRIPDVSPTTRPSSPTPTPVKEPPPAPAPVVVSNVTPRPQPAPPPATAPAVSGLVRALASLDAGQYAEALTSIKAFQDGLPRKPGKLTDTAWIDSLHIQAVAYLMLNQPARATPLLQRLMESGVTERTAVINAAVCDILQKTNAMRAVKNLKTLAAADPQDELAVTLWGVALDTAARRQRLTRLDELTADYLKANTLLERSRPGQHHWGTDWLSDGAWASIESRRATATSTANTARQRLREANARLDNAKDAAQRENVLITGRPVRDFEIDEINRRKRNAAVVVDQCRVEAESAEAAVEAADGSIPRPSWAFDVQPVMPNLLTP